MNSDSRALMSGTKASRALIFFPSPLRSTRDNTLIAQWRLPVSADQRIGLSTSVGIRTAEKLELFESG